MGDFNILIKNVFAKCNRISRLSRCMFVARVSSVYFESVTDPDDTREQIDVSQVGMFTVSGILMDAFRLCVLISLNDNQVCYVPACHDRLSVRAWIAVGVFACLPCVCNVTQTLLRVQCIMFTVCAKILANKLCKSMNGTSRVVVTASV